MGDTIPNSGLDRAFYMQQYRRYSIRYEGPMGHHPAERLTVALRWQMHLPGNAWQSHNHRDRVEEHFETADEIVLRYLALYFPSECICAGFGQLGYAHAKVQSRDRFRELPNRAWCQELDRQFACRPVYPQETHLRMQA